MGNQVTGLCSCNEEQQKSNKRTEYKINENLNHNNKLIEETSKTDPFFETNNPVVRNRRGSAIETYCNDAETQRSLENTNQEELMTDRKIIYKDKSEYIGTTLKGLRHGKGLYKTTDGLVYEGEWKNNKYEGFGSLIYSDNSSYTGNFREGNKEGNGKLVLGKTIYDGEFHDDNKHGQGKETYPDGSCFQGRFEKGKKHGIGKTLSKKGKYILNDGSVYEGEFANDNINGKGSFKWIDNKSYTGEWKDNSIHGFGKFLKQGKLYIGNFENDKKQGLGKYYYTGDKNSFLVGKFKDNALHGLTLHYNNNTIEKVVMMEKNKVKKTLNPEEIEDTKLTEEYANIINFLTTIKE